MPVLPTDNFRSPAALIRFFGLAALWLVIDLWTKHLAAANLEHDTIEFIPGLLHFVYTKNRGAVFGLGQGLRPVFLTVSVIALGFLTWLFATSGRQWFYQLVLGMLLAGVLGNMFDRIVYGYVRDMIHALPAWPWLFPWVFNIADSLLCVGVFLMLVYSVVARPNEQHMAEAEPETEHA